ncbi:glycolate oxidase subunit GlcF [Phenylobacterium sp. J367]|uniref:glycolate oxidase subunit GlcF n=1 Tax=Phenylobacterium sp. J367 TaxID=2898435 RepID=UPI002151002A|nr:glycolate oxidase subunit GlcF [Phenylobacterium sp. J367]MCR5881103.1 glycolate oxidase subunit GlcF [Phenylobacterium sp. J367]
MQTGFTEAQRADPKTREAEGIIRTCVHCGFCQATCPTYVLLGDELDSPRGRIYLIKEMLEQGGPPAPSTVKHIDRCLSCLSCVTTCPSGVDYMHLIDQARAHIETHHRRPWPDRVLRGLLAAILPRPGRFRAAIRLAQAFRFAAPLLPGRLRGMADMAPKALPKPDPAAIPAVFPAVGERRARVALLAGCAQTVVAPEINTAAIQLLIRKGVEVVVTKGAGCCGALPHHLGKEAPSKAFARANIEAWTTELESGGLDAIVVTASGCGTQVKDYAHMFRDEPAWARRAERISALARDVSEYVVEIGGMRAATSARPLRVAYHSACSLQHGQKVRAAPVELLRSAGFEVVESAESHLCCGSAGTYNLLQPEIAGRLRERKVGALEAVRPDVIATGNVGCLTQIAGGTRVPVVHTVELLNWAAGGPAPRGLL